MKKRVILLGLMLTLCFPPCLSACGKEPTQMVPDDFVGSTYTAIVQKLDNSLSLDPLNEQERVIYLAVYWESSVDNGGFASCYYNSVGNYAEETVQAFEALNAAEVAAICRKANSVFGDEVPREWEQRNQLFDTLLDESTEGILAECDEAFYSKEESLHQLEIAYIKENAAYFGR